MGLGNLILIVIGTLWFLFSCYKVWDTMIRKDDLAHPVYFVTVALILSAVFAVMINSIGRIVIPWLNQIKI